MTQDMLNIIIAGGKTGGHLFPGIAVAQALQRMHQRVNILFVGTGAPFEIRTLETYHFNHQRIFSKPVKGGSLISKIISVFAVAVSLFQSIRILNTFKPDFVLGVGGFSSFAVVLAAWLLRIPSAIQEQNAIPGMTNRMLARFCGSIFTSFERTRGFEDNPKVIHTGNPVRTSDSLSNHPESDLPNLLPDKPTLLVTGGSQGAAGINTAFMKAVSLMEDPDAYNIVHQTGPADEKKVSEHYQSLGIRVQTKAFFNAMPQIQDQTDLIITRAGAGILSEICARGLAAILIPFPHAADDHQFHNAKALADAGAAVLIREKDLHDVKLKQIIEELIQNKNKAAEMGRKATSFARPKADETIAARILNSTGMKV